MKSEMEIKHFSNFPLELRYMIYKSYCKMLFKERIQHFESIFRKNVTYDTCEVIYCNSNNDGLIVATTINTRHNCPLESRLIRIESPNSIHMGIHIFYNGRQNTLMYNYFYTTDWKKTNRSSNTTIEFLNDTMYLVSGHSNELETKKGKWEKIGQYRWIYKTFI